MNRCSLGLHKWSRWDLLHRWCLRCRKVQFTELGIYGLRQAMRAMSSDEQSK